MDSDGHLLICGCTNSGKSYLAKYLLFNPKGPLYGKYDLILLISDIPDEIQHNGGGGGYEDIPSQHMKNDISNDTLNKIKQYAHKHNYDKKILILFDDLNKVILDRESYNNIIYLFTEGRHFNIYTMALVQYYKMLKPIIRGNSKYHILTQINNVTLEELYNHVSHCFNNPNELKNFCKALKLDKHVSICFNTHTTDTEIKKIIKLIKPL